MTVMVMVTVNEEHSRFVALCSDRNSESGRNIYQLVCEGLHYLDTRTEFWRQQKPMYSRKRDKAIMARRKKATHILNSDINNYILHELEKIDDGMFNYISYYPARQPNW